MTEQFTTVFVHMPKGGGSSLRLGIECNFKLENREIVHGHDSPPSQKAFQDLNEEQLKNVKFAWGHWPFGYYTRNIGKINDTVWITGIREPVDRLLSEYSQFKEADYYVPGWYAFWYHLFNKYPLKEVLDLNFMKSLDNLEGQQLYRRMSNTQVRMLSNRDNIIMDNAGKSEDGNWAPLEDYILDESHLELAKENLEKYFSWVGLTHLTNKEYNTMSTRFGWTDRRDSDIRHNQTQTRIFEKDCDQETIDKIREWNSLDLQLYDWILNNREKINTRPIRYISSDIFGV